MMTARNLPLPLVIAFLALIRGCSSLVTASPNPLQPRGPVNAASDLQTEDYSVYDDTVATTTPKLVTVDGRKPQRCDYDPCRESQRPCAELAETTDCRCPGVTLNNVAPGAPDVREVAREGSEVVIVWCAPLSHVTSYKVMVEGEVQQEFRDDQRRGAVKIDRSVEVCVVAVNDAGESQGSCMSYEHRDNSVSLKAGLIGGALGFLLLFSLGVLLWRHRARRTSEARISTQDVADGH